MDTPTSPTLTRVEELEVRLEHGDKLIRRMEADGLNTDAHIRHWLKLLHEYELAWKAQSEPVAA